MAKTLSFIFGLAFLVAIPVVQSAVTFPGDPIDNTEQRVTEHGFRVGADQFLPDISGDRIVWQDQRGDSTTFLDPGTGLPRNRIWSKNLGTRDESPVTTLATQFGHPRISGRWVVWHDLQGGDHDVFARRLPGGPILQVTTDAADQMNPAVDGTTVVWEDRRNGNVDIFKKNLTGGAETAVTTAKGRQTSPSISGTTVAWRDARRSPATADVWVRTGTNPAIRAVRVTSPGIAKSFSPYQVALSGNRLLWNEADPGCPDTFDCERPKILKTCVLPCAPASIVQVDSVPSGPDEFRFITDLDVSGSRGGWGDLEDVYTVDLATCDVPPCATKAHVGSSAGGSPLATGNTHVDGQRFAWASNNFSGSGLEGGLDIFWDNVANAAPSQRANSLGLGPFGEHLSPAAEGNLVVYRAPGRGDALGRFQVWATDLSGTRRHFAVSSELGTDTSRPAIVVQRAVWSDLRNCADPCEVSPADDVFQADVLAEPITEVQLSSPDQTGGPADADGSLTAWRCGPAGGAPPNAICVHNGTSLQRIDVSGRLLDPASVIGNLVRISGNLVAWHEVLVADEQEDARLHVLDVSTLDDEIVGKGINRVGEFPDLDISGSTVVWAGRGDPEVSKLWRNTATGCGGTGSQCDHSGGQTRFETPVFNHVLSSPSIRAGRVAWTDCSPFSQFDGCDVYTRTLGEAESHLVTNDSDAGAANPHVAAGRIYWVDGRLGGEDVFMESLSGGVLPAPDTTPPGPPTGFTATRFSNRVELAWTNPAASDFFRVRILRKSGLVAPASLDDTSASVVYEGADSEFTDSDVAAGLDYSYAIFAFDLEPNYSPRVVASTS